MPQKISNTVAFIVFALAAPVFAQNTNSSTPAPEAAAPAATTATTTRTRRTQTPSAQKTRAQAGEEAATSAVRAAFDALLDGIRASDVDAVMGIYWNSPQLAIFNNNGTVTKTWEQVRSNRASSYPNAKGVTLDVRDVRVQMLGTGAAVVSALWTQSQTYKGVAESATGRMTLVFRLVGGEWKIVHAHTSPDAPDPSRLLPSEQVAPPTRTPTKP